jgi:phage terminase small subunit
MRIDMELKLIFPKSTNLQPLIQVLGANSVLKLCLTFCDKSLKERRIKFPSQKDMRKIFAYGIYLKILAGENWEKIKVELKKQGSLESFGLTLVEIRRLYNQRKKEMKKEKQS